MLNIRLFFEFPVNVVTVILPIYKFILPNRWGIQLIFVAYSSSFYDLFQIQGLLKEQIMLPKLQNRSFLRCFNESSLKNLFYLCRKKCFIGVLGCLLV